MISSFLFQFYQVRFKRVFPTLVVGNDASFNSIKYDLNFHIHYFLLLVLLSFNSIKYDLNNKEHGGQQHIRSFNSIKYDLNEVEGMYKEHISSFNSIKYDLNSVLLSS